MEPEKVRDLKTEFYLIPRSGYKLRSFVLIPVTTGPFLAEDDRRLSGFGFSGKSHTGTSHRRE